MAREQLKQQENLIQFYKLLWNSGRCAPLEPSPYGSPYQVACPGIQSVYPLAIKNKLLLLSSPRRATGKVLARATRNNIVAPIVNLKRPAAAAAPQSLNMV